MRPARSRGLLCDSGPAAERLGPHSPFLEDGSFVGLKCHHVTREHHAAGQGTNPESESGPNSKPQCDPREVTLPLHWASVLLPPASEAACALGGPEWFRAECSTARRGALTWSPAWLHTSPRSTCLRIPSCRSNRRSRSSRPSMGPMGQAEEAIWREGVGVRVTQPLCPQLPSAWHSRSVHWKFDPCSAPRPGLHPQI